MAATKVDVASQAAAIIQEVRSGVFKPVYLLMGDEPYYPELICEEIVKNCVDESLADFNQTILYGADVNGQTVADEARRFPMMGDRVLVVVKDAQSLKGLDELAQYLTAPLDSTVLVLLFRKASADKRKAFYKAAQKVGVMLESPAVRDYELPGWISRYYASRGLQIAPDAAALMAESVGAELGTIVVETDKLVKNLPEGCVKVTVQDVEKNIGVSRQFSIFELTKEISFRNGPKALKIATHLGDSAKFAMPMAVSALYTHFSRILRYGALMARGPVDPDDKAKALAGVNPYFYKEYDTAVRNYPLPKAMSIMSLLCEYDYLGKGGDGGAATPGELLVELTAKILNI